MSDFYNFVKNFFSTDECVGNTKYSAVGHTFRFNTDDVEGIFWFYEGENFTIDIHDVFIKKEIIHTSFSGLDNFYSFYSSYLVTANGECFNPYQNISSNSLYIINTKNSKNYRFILHKNSPYLGIGINFKQSMIDECLSSYKNKEPQKSTFVTKDGKVIDFKEEWPKGTERIVVHSLYNNAPQYLLD